MAPASGYSILVMSAPANAGGKKTMKNQEAL